MFDLPTSHASGPARWPAGALLMAWLAIHAGCAGADGAAPTVDATRAQVQQLIGEAVCKTDADCRTVAIGNKACGGPEAYLAWSARQTDPRLLAAAAERYARERTAWNRQSGMMSNCAVVTDPGARCETPGGDGAGAVTDGGAGAGTTARAAATREQPGRCVLRRAGPGIQAN